MDCYACPRPAAHRCTRCGRSYCPDHGLEQCAKCMEPAAIMPSTAVFRGAVALMVVSLVAAVWHVVAWPQFPAPEPLALAPLATRTPFAAIAPPVATATAQGAAAVTTTPGAATATPSGSPTASATAGAGNTATATTTATAAPTQTPAPTATPRPGRRYVVESGDTLSGIASDMGSTVDAITAANGITTDTLLRIGQELIIP